MIVLLFILTCSIPCAIYTAFYFADEIIGNKFIKVGLFFFLLAAFWAPALTFTSSPYSHGSLYLVYYYTIYYFSVACYFLCLLLLLRKCCTLILFRFRAEPRVFRRNADLITLAIALLLSLCALYGGMRVPPVRTITLDSEKITTPIDLVVLGDVHLHRTVLLSKVHGIVERTNALNPDYILIPGDTIDDKTNNIAPHLAIFKNLRAKQGIYAVCGNHEAYVGLNASRAAICDAGFTLLYNDGRVLSPELYIAGVPYRGSGFSPYDPTSTIDYAQAFASRPTDTNPFTILLAHIPREHHYTPLGIVDLQISGHTHGGQIFPFHLVSWLNDRLLAGLYTLGDLRVYVTRGSGQWGPQMRLFAPSEITHIRLVPEK